MTSNYLGTFLGNLFLLLILKWTLFCSTIEKFMDKNIFPQSSWLKTA